MTYNIPEFRQNLKKAFQAAKQGEVVLITRHDETFRLVLERDLRQPIIMPIVLSDEVLINDLKISSLEKPFLPCPHGRQATKDADGWKHCPHCLGLNERSPIPFEEPVINKGASK